MHEEVNLSQLQSKKPLVDFITFGSIPAKMADEDISKTWVYDAENKIVIAEDLQRLNGSAHSVLLDKIDPPFETQTPYTSTFLNANVGGSIKPDGSVEFKSGTINPSICDKVDVKDEYIADDVREAISQGSIMSVGDYNKMDEYQKATHFDNCYNPDKDNYFYDEAGLRPKVE